jgi:hypothetical protein
MGNINKNLLFCSPLPTPSLVALSQLLALFDQEDPHWVT